MKRSNRLILLIGLFLAAIAFVLIVITLNGNNATGPTTPTAPTTATIVVAAQDIPLGTTITAPMVTTKDVPIGNKPVDSFALPEVVIGKIARTNVTSGAIISSETFSAAASLVDIGQLLDAGLGAVSVQVDQTSGVGTLIQPGDRVDVVLSMNDALKNPIVVEKAPTKEGQPPTTVRNFELANPLLNSTSVKVLVQNVQVVGTILPPPVAAQGTTPAANGAAPAPTPATTLNGQSQIVILALTAQQAELVRFTQLDGNLSLVLRSPKDKDAPAVKTTGITLRQLVDSYGVVPPKIILTEQP